MVEHTAHNGPVVGSSPTKPNTNMEFNLRKYQILNTKMLLKSKNIFVFSAVAKLNSKNWLLKEQSLDEFNIKVQKLNNKASKKSIENSIYQNIKHIFKGALFTIIFNKNSKVKIDNLQNLDIIIPFLIKINNKIYTINQIKKLRILNYKFKVLELIKTLKIHKRTIV